MTKLFILFSVSVAVLACTVLGQGPCGDANCGASLFSFIESSTNVTYFSRLEHLSGNVTNLFKVSHVVFPTDKEFTAAYDYDRTSYDAILLDEKTQSPVGWSFDIMHAKASVSEETLPFVPSAYQYDSSTKTMYAVYTIGNSAQLMAVNGSTGQMLHHVGQAEHVAPVFAAASALWYPTYYAVYKLVDGSYGLFAFDLHTGAPLSEHLVYITYSEPVVALGGAVYDDGTGTLVAVVQGASGAVNVTRIEPTSGATTVLYTHAHATVLPHTVILVTYERVVAYVVSTAAGEYTLCGVSVESGELQWSHVLPGRPTGLVYALFK